MNDGSIGLLRQKLGEIADVNSAIALLQWDQETYMPPKGANARGQQLATLSALSHRLLTAPELGILLEQLRQRSTGLDPDDAILVSETQYDVKRSTKLPESFVHEFAEEQSKAFQVWVEARAQSDFRKFQPNLERMVELLRRKADLLGYEGSPYNALLEEFERGMTAEQLRPLFAELAEQQSGLVKQITNAHRALDTNWLNQEWAPAAQWELSLRVLREMGYDLEAGRQDKSVHPFTTSFDKYDVRITTRISSKDLFSGLMGSIHEGGHALYDQGFLDKDRRGTLASAPSLGVHESQSRMWENLVGRSLPFWKRCLPALNELFPSQFERVTAEAVYAAVNRVQPSLIRVEADECTYNLHIILRFEIEVALIEGTLKVSEIPDAWNAKVKAYLGLDVPNDAQGCLQDIHWSHGAMGYFPTYALGNLYAAQLFEKILEEIPDLWSRVEAGDFAALLAWLRRRVHVYGRRKTANEIICEATGQPPSAAPFLRYLAKKYGALYSL
ncbi:MAG: carboxypeptidase M32 [Candidatus Hydrogenedentes bacterium]|nr:carboxypeptidase M32 [Candidatus Hydrogenedentota bacterium]